MIPKLLMTLNPLQKYLILINTFLNLEQRVIVNMHIAKSNLPVLKIGQFWKVQN